MFIYLKKNPNISEFNDFVYKYKNYPIVYLDKHTRLNLIENFPSEYSIILEYELSYFKNSFNILKNFIFAVYY